MPREHVVQQGEGISSIANRYGFAPHLLWYHPGNEELRKLRGDGDILLPGDIVHIPDKEPRQRDAATDKRHRFQRLGVPSELRLQLWLDDRPRAKVSFRLIVDGGPTVDGTTDERGVLVATVPPNAASGRLVVGGDEYALSFGRLNPVTDASGIQQRLKNLGFYAGDVTGTIDVETCMALADFQRSAGLPVTGENDAATLARLEQWHDHEQSRSRDADL
jgi:N-acetylmuramoyl-L-alanine amidase